jgi:hypothetical protein
MNGSKNRDSEGVNPTNVDENIKFQSANFLRTEWISFFKWTTGISTFLISISLTAITFGNSISILNKAIGGTVVALLTSDIILSWSLLKIALFKVYKIMDISIQGRLTINNNMLKEYNDAISTIEEREPKVFTLFVLGIVFFLIFFISIVLK